VSGRDGSPDPAEIRGRMAVCFSLLELQRLAGELGVTGVAWERGVGEAAREVVRHFERRGDLGALVAALRAARPLVEWPEPPPSPWAQAPDPPAPEPVFEASSDAPLTPRSVPEGVAATSPTGPPAPPEALEGEAAPPSALGSDPPDLRAGLRWPHRPSEASVVPLAPGAASTGSPDGSRTTAQPPPPSGAPIQDPYALSYAAGGAGWPGTEPQRPPEAPARRASVWLLFALAGLMAGAVVIAFVAGRASSPGDAAAPASSAPAAGAGGEAARSAGVAARVAAAIDRRAASVARSCGIGPGDAGEIVRRAFLRCGPEPAPATAVRPSRPAAGGAEAPAEPPRRAPDATRPRPVAPVADPPLPPNAGCIAGCDRDHKACKASKCGSEPKQSSQYKQYQDCLSDCLRAASKCRLSCQ
jgi:hypothetical protein